MIVFPSRPKYTRQPGPKFQPQFGPAFAQRLGRAEISRFQPPDVTVNPRRRHGIKTLNHPANSERSSSTYSRISNNAFI